MMLYKVTSTEQNVYDNIIGLLITVINTHKGMECLVDLAFEANCEPKDIISGDMCDACEAPPVYIIVHKLVM